MLSSVVPNTQESAGVVQPFQPRKSMTSTATSPALEISSKLAVVMEREPELADLTFLSSRTVSVTMEATQFLFHQVPLLLLVFLYLLLFLVHQSSILELETTRVLDATPRQQLAEL